LVHGAGQRRAGTDQQISDRGGPIVQGGDSGADGVAVLREPADQLLKAVDGSENLVPSLSTVPTTVLRLSMSSCTVWLLSANVLVNDVVCDNSEFRVPLSPWKTWMSDALSALTSCGLRPG